MGLTESHRGEKCLGSAFPCDQKPRGFGGSLCNRLSSDSDSVVFCFFPFDDQELNDR